MHQQQVVVLAPPHGYKQHGLNGPQSPAAAAAAAAAAAMLWHGATPTESQRDLQRLRLIEAKDALGPGTFNCLDSWDPATSPCTGTTINWSTESVARGVIECIDGLVTKLDFINCGFAGVLPASWGDRPGMEGLVSIDLSTSIFVPGGSPNRLTGPLPASWSRLASLSALNLKGNLLTGQLPVSWGTLSGLQTLFLDNNQFTGQLPESWGGMAAMEGLSLSSNTNLGGTIPCAWGTMGNQSTGALLGGPPRALFVLALGSTGVTGCYPTTALQTAGSTGDTPTTQIAGVRGEWSPGRAWWKQEQRRSMCGG
jgi:hypothetical protein